MSLKAKFYNITKKVNSTALPTGNAELELDIDLKANCSIVNPVLILYTGLGAYTNYCYIPALGRYYWVNDWTYAGNVWEISCSVDVLATYREQIMNYSLYFTRCSTANDGNIVDRLYPIKQIPTREKHTIVDGAYQAGEYGLISGKYVIGIVGKDGLTDFYVFSYAEFKDFCDKVFGSMDWSNVSSQELSEEVLKCVVNPFQYVMSCLWFPFDIQKTVSAESISLGFWDIGVTAKKLSPNPVQFDTFKIPVSQHPQVARGEFLNGEPFRKINIYIPPVGVITLDSSVVGSSTELTCIRYYDLMTGYEIIYINRDDYTLATVVGKIGVPIQVSDMQTNINGMMNGVGNAVSGLLGTISGNPIGGVIGMLSGIGQAVSSANPVVAGTIGSNGSMVATHDVPYIEEIYYSITDEDNADNGRPYCKNGTMKALGTGYYIAENGNISITGAFENERVMIKNYLEGGVYYA